MSLLWCGANDLNSQCMQTCVNKILHRIIHKAVACYEAFVCKERWSYSNLEMRTKTSSVCACMAIVQTAFVYNVKLRRRHARLGAGLNCRRWFDRLSYCSLSPSLSNCHLTSTECRTHCFASIWKYKCILCNDENQWKRITPNFKIHPLFGGVVICHKCIQRGHA